MALAEGAARAGAALEAAETSTGLVINLFWVIAAAVTVIVFIVAISQVFFKPVSATLEARIMMILASRSAVG